MSLDITALEALPARDDAEGLPGGRTIPFPPTLVCFGTIICL